MNTILITGATSGLGLELAKLYKSEKLVLIGRKSLSELDASIFNLDNYCQADLSQDGFIESILDFLNKRDINKLDLIIQNAAIGYFGNLNQSNIDALLKTNLYAPIEISHALLAKLSQAGKIVFINSISANFPAPEYSVYAATKAALAAFARNIALEERKKIQTIYLGAVNTGMHQKSGVPVDRFKIENFPSASKTAQQVQKAINKNQKESTIGFLNKLSRKAGKYGLLDILNKKPVNSKKRVCAITGAASGIGKALVNEYLAKGFQIIAIDRDSLALAELVKNEPVKIKSLVSDLASDNDLEKILASLYNIDIFIHSARISAVGRFIETDLEKQKTVLNINLRAVLILTKALLAEQKISKGGSLVFVSSLSHQASYPGAAVYAASKDGISSFARSLRKSLKDIHVLTVYPGPTKTPHAAKYSPENSNENKRMPPEILAKKIFNSVKRQKSSLVPSFMLQVFARAGTYFPYFTEQLMLKTLYKKIEKQNSEASSQ